MENLIKEIMENNFDTKRLEEELESIIIDTMDELYHSVAHEILSEFDLVEVFAEVVKEYYDIPF